MTTSNDAALLHKRGKVDSLRTLCKDAFLAADSVGFKKNINSTPVTKVFVIFEGEEQLYAYARTQEQLDDIVESATVQELVVSRIDRDAVIYEENFRDQDIADSADAEITRITTSWAMRPKKATEASMVKLIIAYHNRACLLTRSNLVVKVNQFANVGWDDLEELRDDILEATKEPGSNINLGLKIVRDRIRDLGTLFGSVKNLRHYREALETHEYKLRKGRYSDKVRTEVKWSPGLVQWKDERALYKLLRANLGRDVVKMVVTEGDQKFWFHTCVTPAELAELIGLKLALAMRHEAVDVEEIKEEERYKRIFARYLQDRTDRPTMGSGTKHPSELAKLSHLRDNAPDSDYGIYYARSVVLKSGRVAHVIGNLGPFRDWGDNNVVPVSMPEPVFRDWEVFLSVKSPGTHVDRTKAKVNGEFPETYTGPSFMKLVDGEDGLPMAIHTGEYCKMHDPFKYGEWVRGGRSGKFEGCGCSHITKLMIRPDWWTPKLSLPAIKLDKNDEPYESTSSVDCRPGTMWIDVVDNGYGKTKEKLTFADEDMFMPLYVKAFKDYIYECMATGEFAAAPILEETIKRGVLLGENLDRLESIEDDIRMMEEEGDPEVTGLYEKLDEMEEIRKEFDTVHHQVHLFLPMRSTLFRTELLPEGFSKMCIAVQISGARLDEQQFTKEHQGLRIRTQYSEDGDGHWELVRRDYYQY
jgi:hypothetical protein